MRKLSLRTFIYNPKIVLEYKDFRKIRDNTLLAPQDLFQMKKIIEKVNIDKIEGSIVEAGCWKGGCGAYMAMKDKRRKVFLVDSFEGMPEPDELDVKMYGKKNLKKGDLVANFENVKKMIMDNNLSNVSVHKGFFNEILPKIKNQIGKIAILRMDGDFYKSTIDTLENLYDQVEHGGVVVLDDWHDFEGFRKAVFDFFSKRGEYPNIKDQFPPGKPHFVKK